MDRRFGFTMSRKPHDSDLKPPPKQAAPGKSIAMQLVERSGMVKDPKTGIWTHRDPAEGGGAKVIAPVALVAVTVLMAILQG